MKAVISGLISTTLLLGGAAMVGCDRTVEKHESVETHRDGSKETRTEEKNVKSDGTVETKKETEKTPPTNP